MLVTINRNLSRHAHRMVSATRIPWRYTSGSPSRSAADTLADVKYALDHDMLMPTPDVVAISSILASHGYYKTALDSLRLCNPHDIYRPANIKDIISGVILRYFDSSSSPETCFQHISMSLDLITMLKLKHGKYKHGGSARAMIVAGTLYPQFVQCYRFCTTPHPLHDQSLGVLDVVSVPNSLVAAVVVESIKQYRDSLVSGYYNRDRDPASPHSAGFDEAALDQFLHTHCVPITIITDRGRGVKAKAKFDTLVAVLLEELQISRVGDLFRSNLRALVSARSDIRRPLDSYGRSVASVLTLSEYEALMCEYIYGSQEVAARSAMVAVVPAAEVHSLVRRSLARHHWACSVPPLGAGEIFRGDTGADTDRGGCASLSSRSSLVDGVGLSIIADISNVVGRSPLPHTASSGGCHVDSGTDGGEGMGTSIDGDEDMRATFWEDKMKPARHPETTKEESSRFVLRIVKDMRLGMRKKK